MKEQARRVWAQRPRVARVLAVLLWPPQVSLLVWLLARPPYWRVHSQQAWQAWLEQTVRE